MRVIKFRVWDSEKKEWTLPNFQCDNTGLLNNEETKEHRFIFHQFTGLKDNKEKEIYDGDLILGDGYGPYRVFWDDDFGGWCSCCYSDAELIAKYKSIEVIGHVFDGTEYEGVL